MSTQRTVAAHCEGAQLETTTRVLGFLAACAQLLHVGTPWTSLQVSGRPPIVHLNARVPGGLE